MLVSLELIAQAADGAVAPLGATRCGCILAMMTPIATAQVRRAMLIEIRTQTRPRSAYHRYPGGPCGVVAIAMLTIAVRVPCSIVLNMSTECCPNGRR